MKYLIIISLSALFSLCIHLKREPVSYTEGTPIGRKLIATLSAIKFDSVVAYDFPGDTDIPLIDTSGTITNTVTKTALLDSSQFELLKEILLDTTTFGNATPNDFYPCFGIVFYRDHTIAEYLEVSLACSSLHASFNIPAQERLEDQNQGLSKKGVERVFSLCKSLGFKNYLSHEELNKMRDSILSIRKLK